MELISTLAPALKTKRRSVGQGHDGNRTSVSTALLVFFTTQARTFAEHGVRCGGFKAIRTRADTKQGSEKPVLGL
jgi:hypothetical protein